MKKLILLLIALCVAVFGRHFDSWEEVLEHTENARQELLKKCMGGNMEACEEAIENKFLKNNLNVNDTYSATYIDGSCCHTRKVFDGYKKLEEYSCKDYMKIIKKGCALGSGLCCAKLGDEYNSISVHGYFGKWVSKYGRNCSLKNQNEAFKYYRKSCELGESDGCARYSEFEMDLAEIESRERDKTQKSDITIRRK